ncbi:hypothetical protein [Rhodopila globiformis]|uniref:Uncharacterized protein n=1 Tax=Rhodopila globiformis TaxID=1071 RepID=A0A2S6NB52_RHOGL|nr:hypothetical protein [Rhodopila globiformis]PPQ31821.1 hypothetical protein CCS01_16520 [Rhodopila globiformis]
MVTDAALDKVQGFPTPLFRDAAADNAAREAAVRQTPTSYDARNHHALRFTARSIVFSAGNLGALSRVALQNEARPGKARGQPPGQAMAAPVAQLRTRDLPARPDIQDLADFARVAWKTEKVTTAAQPVATLSRQQRRFAGRQPELEPACLARRADRRLSGLVAAPPDRLPPSRELLTPGDADWH